ncbi:MAG: hypothetical protein J7L89_07095, partial [Bacteroidales bacterium]|nr:hypothetical protein [Bacteroidales bacterium]
GELYRSDDAGESWIKISDKKTDLSGKAGYSFNQLYADPVNPDHVFIVGSSMLYSYDGGKTWPRDWKSKRRFRSNFGDVRCFWIDPTDSRHMMLGSDGGIYATWDGGLTMNHFYQLPTEEVYDVEVDQSIPYNIYVGLQDHETWKGPSNSWSGSIGIEDWFITGMWDGMYTKVDPENNRYLYFTTQFGVHHRVDQLEGKRWNIVPKPPKGEGSYRFTWTTPLELSPHNPSIIYTGGQYLLRSLDRGNHWEKISPDLTTNNPRKINGKGHMQHCTISTISESRVKAGVIWVGTDDGKVQVTEDFGHHWTDCTGALVSAGAPETTWVSRVVASSHFAGRAYICKSGFREDIFDPFIYRTNDYGKTWTSLTSGLPDAPVSVIFEDPENPNLLYSGTDKGVFVTFNGGDHWISFTQNIPPAPVRDLLVHPREKDLVVGTYGRGTWITDVSPLPEINDSILASPYHLFKLPPQPITYRSDRAGWGNYQMMGDNHLRTPNEPDNVTIYYYINPDSKSGKVSLALSDWNGHVLSYRSVKSSPGIHKTHLNSRRTIVPGFYRVTLKAGKHRYSKPVRILPTPKYPIGHISKGSAR